jgi:hypothetical protein
VKQTCNDVKSRIKKDEAVGVPYLVPLELAAGKMRTSPTSRSVGTRPGLASSRSWVVVPSLAAMESKVSPDTIV